MNQRGKGLKILIWIEVIVLVIAVVFGVLKKNFGDPLAMLSDARKGDQSQENILYLSEEGEEEEPIKNENTFGDQNPRTKYSDEVEAKISEMTLEEKVAQMFLVSPETLTGQDAVTLSGSATQSAINTYPVGGIVYSSVNLMGSEQFAQMLSGVQGYSNERIGLNLFTVVSEPGGDDGSSIAGVCNFEVQKGAASLGEQGDSNASQQAASAIGNYLALENVNMNLAPLADVSSTEDTSAETFGTDPDLVGEHVGAQIRGYLETGVTSVLGKFPGTHDVTVNEGALPVCNRTLEEMQVSDFVSFQYGIDAGAKAVMLANVTSRSLTGNAALPCSMSAQVVTTLRDDMGFSGIIISDQLNDPVITAAYPDGSAAVEAVKAGVDMLYYTEDFITAYDAVLEAVNNGTISEESIDDSVGKILTLKFGI